ncbi:nucleotide sugar dehydrogenase [Absicoccus porci]|jgi:UDP-N-acetyl-D-galactosamine dehydrogenase|uniref:nucleotide sugar dehydrogenase n=1 Tax=Absicoccus porci TaxID=2486576 RepID=UPI003D8DF98B
MSEEGMKMNVYDQLIAGQEKLALVGLGYVGMPMAVAFAQKGIQVIGFDLNKEKIKMYQKGVDPTKEVGDDAISHTTISFSADEHCLQEAKFLIVAVPTPVNLDHTPDLSPVIRASEMVGRNLTKGSIVVFESTVYPGVTEDVCIPALEKASGLTCGKDFKVGYSPERINPGDPIHRLENIRKIVSAIDKETLEIIQNVYNLVIQAGTYPVSNLKTAEAIKVVENSQRDINIAFMNELAMVFDRMDIDTQEVIDGMNTKWNALGFKPGLVGGHCIGVDPYYFIYEAERLGYHSQIILSGRKVNDDMGKFIADSTIKQTILAKKAVVSSNFVILGMTFKENCPDIRNSKVYDIICELNAYGVHPRVVDPWVSSKDAEREYHVQLTDMDQIHDADVVIIAVAHSQFLDMGIEGIDQLYKKELSNDKKVLIDVKSIFDRDKIHSLGYHYWRL